MRPILPVLALLTALGVTGCSDDEPSGGSSDPTSASTGSSGPASPSETAASEPARDVCKVLGAEDVGKILGTDVKRVVAEGGCRFASPDDAAAASLGISQGTLRELGGIDGAKAGITAVVEGEPQDVPDVGDGAFVVVGPTFGGATRTGGGAVALGSSLVQITVIPEADASDEKLATTTVDLLTLIAEQAGR